MQGKMQDLKERIETGEFVQSTEDIEKTDLTKLEKYD
jgi:hypothetical protein